MGLGLDEPLNKQSIGCAPIMHNAEVLFVLFLIDHKLVRTSGMGHSRSYYVAAFLSLVESSFPFSSSGWCLVSGHVVNHMLCLKQLSESAKQQPHAWFASQQLSESANKSDRPNFQLLPSWCSEGSKELYTSPIGALHVSMILIWAIWATLWSWPLTEIAKTQNILIRARSA